MKLAAIISSIIAGSIALVNAQQNAGIYITSPIFGTVWKAGVSQSISWTSNNANVTTIDNLELRKGNASNLAFVQTIHNGSIPISTGHYSWNVSSNLTTDASYVLLAKSTAGTSYSSFFTIMGQTNSTTKNVTSSAVPSAVYTAVVSSSHTNNTSAVSSAVSSARASASASL